MTELPAAARTSTDLWFSWPAVEHVARTIAARWGSERRGFDSDHLLHVRVRGTSPSGPVNYWMGVYRHLDPQRAAAQIAYALNGQWVYVRDNAHDWIRVEAFWPNAPWRPDAPPVPLQATTDHDWWIR